MSNQTDDLVSELRGWSGLGSQLMQRAADELERLMGLTGDAYEYTGEDTSDLIANLPPSDTPFMRMLRAR